MATFTSKYGIGDTVYVVVEHVSGGADVVRNVVESVKHSAVGGIYYWLSKDDTGWTEECRVYATQDEAQSQLRKELLRAYKEDLAELESVLRYHERCAAGARNGIESLQAKIRGLEGSTDDTTDKEGGL